MKLSKVTREILKNFHTINQGIVFKAGNSLRTISVQADIIANAQIEEEFPVDFAIYDLSELLNTIGIFPNPELTFTNEHLPFTISEGKQVVKYVPSRPDLVVSGWSASLVMTEEMKDVTFILTKEVLEQIFKTSSILTLPDLSITNSGLKVSNKKDPTGNQLGIDIDFDKKMSDKFDFSLRVQNLKIIPMNYIAEISSAGLAHFVSENGNIEYFIALDA
jgi:hypothetical protein